MSMNRRSFIPHTMPKLGRVAVLCAVMTLAAGLAFSQQSVETNTDSQAQKNNSDLEEITVTAQRREERLIDVPVSVQAIDGSTLDRSVFTTTTDILRLSPSVNFQQGSPDPSSSSVAIRGLVSFAIEGGGVQPSTATIINDVPTTRQGEFVTDLADIERIEVLRGPQGTLFGKNATAGVINIIENKPTDKYEGSIEVGDTTDDEKSLRGIINIPLNDSVRTRIVAFWREQGKLQDNVDPFALSYGAQNPGASESYGISGKLAIDLSSNVDLLIAGDVSYLQSYNSVVILQPDSSPALAAIQRAAGVVAPYNNPFINSEDGGEQVSKPSGISANLTAHLSDQWTLKSVTAYRQYYDDSATDTDSGPWGAIRGIGILPNPLGYPYLYVGENASQLPRAPDRTTYSSEELRLAYSTDRLDLILGGFTQLYKETKYNTVPFIGDFTGTGTLYYSDTVVDATAYDNDYSVFGDATYKVTSEIALFGGLRESLEKLHLNYQNVTYFTPDFNPISLEPIGPGTPLAFSPSQGVHNLSGRAGIRFEPSREHSYYFSYSRGYKGPAENIYREATLATAFLKPEISSALELGTKHELFENRVAINADVFYQKTENSQQSALVPGQVYTALENVGAIKAYGVEEDLTARLSQAVRIDSSFSYVHADYEGLVNSCYPNQTVAQGCVDGAQNLAGTQSAGSPRFAGNVEATRDIALPASIPFNSFIRIGYNYTGPIQYGLTADPLERQAGHISLDATIGLTGRTNNWQLLIYGRNLTNDHYYGELQAADNFLGRQFTETPSRDFWRYGGVKLKVSF
jgi:iron complex outermembrane recepter protein